MSQKLDSAIAVIGIDIGKNSFHIVGHDQRGAIVLRQKWSRGQVETRLANLPPCLIGMEACVGAHHLSRKLQMFGHDARLMPAKYVRPYSNMLIAKGGNRVRNIIRCLLICFVCLTGVSSVTSAAPASCARNFIGSWRITVNATGQTYVGQYTAGGQAIANCPMCATGTWTCSGNVLTVFVNGQTVVGTLSSDGMHLSGGCCTATRLGAAPAVAARTERPRDNSDASVAPESKQKPPSATSQPPLTPTKNANTTRVPAAKKSAAAPEPTTSARSSSCSDITGTSSTSAAASHCKDADRALYAARQVRQSNPQVTAAEYKKAAAAARRAGDNNLELSILREAMEPAGTAATAVVAAVTANTPAASAAAPFQPAVGGVPRMWDGRRETCDDAKELERATAGYYYECVLGRKSEAEKANATSHRPMPDPMELGKRARQACGSYSADAQQCFADFKLKVILAQNPGMREACEKKAAQQSPLRQRLSERLGTRQRNNQERFLECVDNAYLYGSLDEPPKPKGALSDALRKRLNAAADPDDQKRPADGSPKRSLCWSPGRCCPPGYGLKPTPGAFGAWSCQPLRLFALDTTRPRLDPKDEADLIEDFEERVNDTAVNAVTAAVAALGSTMSESDREACAAASFAVVHATLKGGAPSVPEQCRAMASAARGYLAYYADVHVDNSNNAMEDLLASFRSDLGAPLPGMIGLTPDERQRRQGECMLRGSSAESCN